MMMRDYQYKILRCMRCGGDYYVLLCIMLFAKKTYAQQQRQQQQHEHTYALKTHSTWFTSFMLATSYYRGYRAWSSPAPPWFGTTLPQTPSQSAWQLRRQSSSSIGGERSRASSGTFAYYPCFACASPSWRSRDKRRAAWQWSLMPLRSKEQRERKTGNGSVRES